MYAGARSQHRLCWLVTAALLATTAGAALLAYRWSTPLGNLTIDRIGLLCLIGLIVTAGHDRAAMSAFKPLVRAIIALCALWLPSMLYSPTFSQGFVQFSNIVVSMALFLVSMRAGVFLLRRGKWERLTLVPVLAFIPTALIGLHQAGVLLVGGRPSIPFMRFTRPSEAAANSARTAFGSGLNEYGLDRVAAATGDPSTYGFACAITMIFTLWLQRTSHLRRPAVLYAVWSVGSIGIIASASATAVAVLCLGTVSFFLPVRRRVGVYDRQRIMLATGGAVLLTALAMTHDGLRLFVLSAYERIGMLLAGGGSLSAHLELRAFAWRVFSEHPLWGVGAGSLSTLQYGYEVPFSSVHNVLLLRLAEGGLIGAAGLALFSFTLYRYIPLPLYVAALSGWLLYLDFARLPFLWVVLGISAALTSAHGQLDRAGVRPSEPGHQPLARGGSVRTVAHRFLRERWPVGMRTAPGQPPSFGARRGRPQAKRVARRRA